MGTKSETEHIRQILGLWNHFLIIWIYPKNRKKSTGFAVERAFGILKARLRCLLNCLDHNIENLSDVIIRCCVLHNICQMKGHSYINNDDIQREHTLHRERERRTQRREEREFHASASMLLDILTEYANADNWEML